MKKMCMILPLALILCFMVGCQDKAAMAELDAMQAQAEVEEQNKASFRYMLEARFLEGKIVEAWGVGDILTLMQQLGMELKPKEGEK